MGRRVISPEDAQRLLLQGAFRNMEELERLFEVRPGAPDMGTGEPEESSAVDDWMRGAGERFNNMRDHFQRWVRQQNDAAEEERQQSNEPPGTGPQDKPDPGNKPPDGGNGGAGGGAGHKPPESKTPSDDDDDDDEKRRSKKGKNGKKGKKGAPKDPDDWGGSDGGAGGPFSFGPPRLGSSPWMIPRDDETGGGTPDSSGFDLGIAPWTHPRDDDYGSGGPPPELPAAGNDPWILTDPEQTDDDGDPNIPEPLDWPSTH